MVFFKSVLCRKQILASQPRRPSLSCHALRTSCIWTVTLNSCGSHSPNYACEHFINSLLPPLHKYLRSVFHVPGSPPSAGNPLVDETRTVPLPVLKELTSRSDRLGETLEKQLNKERKKKTSERDGRDEGMTSRVVPGGLPRNSMRTAACRMRKSRHF